MKLFCLHICCSICLSYYCNVSHLIRVFKAITMSCLMLVGGTVADCEVDGCVGFVSYCGVCELFPGW